MSTESPEKIYKYLDLSGYAFTGKHAVIDLMREFRGYCVPHFQFEFNLLRIQGGIRDLETALVDDWSLIRSDAALRRFEKLVKRLAGRNYWLGPASWFSAIGAGYDEYFHGQFSPLSKKYVEGLVEAAWHADWPYPLTDISAGELFFRKLLRQLRIRRAMDFNVRLSAPKNFLDLTKSYLNGLMAAFADNQADIHTVVMHNSFEPVNPIRAARYFHDAKCIIVDRDPRDNYVAGLWYRPTALPPEQFIHRYRLYREAVGGRKEEDGIILRINFEDLVLDYQKTLEKILAFLGETSASHVSPKKYFDPAVSVKNVGIWKSYPKQDEITAIARELKEYCRT